MSFLELVAVRKVFGSNAVVEHFDLSVARGEFVSFLGPSGCGKTTTLRMIAGFESPSAGTIRIDGEEVTHLAPNARRVGMVFQSYALFPNLTVADNVAFGLRITGRPKADIAARVDEMLAMIKLPHLADRYPYQLSGGQQQRVALARAVAVKPRLLLLDEPLSALDAKIRISLRAEIRALQRDLGITTIYVTHDQEEALSMSDRIVVMSEGRIEQVGSPFEIYNRPSSRFVASFVGTLNMLPGRVTAPGQIAVDGQAIEGPTDDLDPGADVSLALRPEALTLVADDHQTNRLAGEIEEVAFLGSVVRLRVAIGSSTVMVDLFNDPAAPPPPRGTRVTLFFSPRDVQRLGDTAKPGIRGA